MGLFGSVLERGLDPSEEIGVLGGGIGPVTLVGDEVGGVGGVDRSGGADVDTADKNEKEGAPNKAFVRGPLVDGGWLGGVPGIV